MARKRGKLSTEEEKFIQDNANNLPLKNIAAELRRTEKTVREYCIKNRLTYTGMSEEIFDDTVLFAKLETRPYWAEVQHQFTDSELEYFRQTWVRLMKQMREDITYSEEVQLKQWITLDIMSNRTLKDRKRAVEQVDRLQELLDREYDVDVELRDTERIAALETELSMQRNSIGTYTTEHSKILDRTKHIEQALKVARDQRVKKIEDSKSSWAGFMRALEDEELRAKVGEDLAIGVWAKEKAKSEFSRYHTYEDGQVAQPFLTSETKKDD
jgi:hypothetical protein